MQASQAPAKFPIPFASHAGSAGIRAIPVASQITTNPGAASLTDGFVPLNFIPVAAGGIPPSGQDMNGILNQITSWDQWSAAGGPVRYDAAFSTTIGGYPSGALVQSNSGHAVYESLVDNNVADPNSGSAQWRVSSCVWTTQSYTATGSANIQTVTLSPAPTSLGQLIGLQLRINSQGVNTGSTTLNVNGLGAIPIQFAAGVPLGAGVLQTNSPFLVVYNGSSFVLVSFSSVFTDVSGGRGGIIIDGSANSGGSNLQLKGPGANPNKWLRALNGVFQVVNNAYTTVIASVDDIGNMAVSGSFQAAGNIFSNVRLRAAAGALGSGDPSAAAILSDFNNFAANPGFQQLPSGYKLIWNSGTTVSGQEFVNFPELGFPTIGLHVIAQEANPQGWLVGGAGNFFVTQFACQQVTQSSFALYCLRWNPGLNTWTLAPGVAYRYLAFGF